jgi:hypothetical protein
MKLVPADKRTGQLLTPKGFVSTPAEFIVKKWAPRIRCHDCPGKSYIAQPSEVGQNFLVHLRSLGHLERVELRTQRRKHAIGQETKSHAWTGEDRHQTFGPFRRPSLPDGPHAFPDAAATATTADMQWPAVPMFNAVGNLQISAPVPRPVQFTNPFTSSAGNAPVVKADFSVITSVHSTRRQRRCPSTSTETRVCSKGLSLLQSWTA